MIVLNTWEEKIKGAKKATGEFVEKHKAKFYVGGAIAVAIFTGRTIAKARVEAQEEAEEKKMRFKTNQDIVREKAITAEKERQAEIDRENQLEKIRLQQLEISDGDSPEVVKQKVEALKSHRMEEKLNEINEKIDRLEDFSEQIDDIDERTKKIFSKADNIQGKLGRIEDRTNSIYWKSNSNNR